MPRASVTTGTPSRTTSPSGTDVRNRIKATTMYDATAPENRANTSYMPPIRCASLATVATTSPVAIWRGRASPVWAAWVPSSWMIRNDAWSQLATAARCRMRPHSAVATASPSTAPDQSRRSRESWATTPASIALPIVAGIRACETNQRMPQHMPFRSETHCSLAIHASNRPGDLRSGRPASS